MNDFLIPLFLLIGIVGLYFGAEFLVRGGASLALRIGVPTLVIGLTIMGYGTGTPELVVSIQASLAGKGDIALGNVLGSNIANTGLIIGIAALCRPLPVKSRLVRRDGPIMVIVSLLLCFLLLFNHDLSQWKGILLISGLVIYTIWAIYSGKKENNIDKETKEEVKSQRLKNIWVELAFLGLGFFLLTLGGKFFLDGAVALAKKFAVSDAMIGLTVVALGTSLPELAMSVIAVFKRHEDLALGNVVGSNIFNILAVVGVAAIINPIRIVGITWVDYSYMMLLACILLVIFRTGSAITRWEGALMLLLYIGYIAYLLLNLA